MQLSVVIAFRNEEKNLPQLLNCLRQQTYKNVEYIFVNDHSYDNGEKIISEQFENALVIKAKKEGKKFALQEGILQASGDWIVCTDADCVPQPQWLETIAETIQSQQCDLLVLPVMLSFRSQSLFERLQATEFVAIQSLTRFCVKKQHAIMCNGANLAFRKSLYINIIQQNPNTLRNEISSGDDIFLLHAFKKNNHKITTSDNPQSIVFTSASSSFSAFFAQRTRWAGKAYAFTDSDTVVVGLLTILLNLSMLILPFFLFLNPMIILILGVIFIIKLSIETFFVQKESSFFNFTPTFSTIILLSVIYPIYAISSVFFGTIKTLNNK